VKVVAVLLAPEKYTHSEQQRTRFSRATENLVRGRRVAGVEPRHLAGQPGGGGGLRGCHTLSRVNTV